MDILVSSSITVRGSGVEIPSSVPITEEATNVLSRDPYVILPRKKRASVCVLIPKL